MENLENRRRHSRRTPSVYLMYIPMFNGLGQGITLHDIFDMSEQVRRPNYVML